MTVFWATESVVILDRYKGFLCNGSSSSLHAVWAHLDHISKGHADGVLFGARRTAMLRSRLQTTFWKAGAEHIAWQCLCCDGVAELRVLSSVVEHHMRALDEGD